MLAKHSAIKVAVITGLGGVGKTQTALEYAYRHRKDYQVVWWIEADSTAGLDRGSAELAAELRLPGADPADPARTRAALCRWMERESGWLLILDNADQPQALRGYLPPVPAGHLLITSRNPLFRKIGKVLNLDPWPREQSMEFLLRRTDCNDRDGAAALAAELGDLPLALEQAATYVEATGQSFAGYLALYRKRFTELAGADEFRPQQYPDTILTTWTVSLAAAERESPVAGDLLRVLAFLAPENIPRDLLTGHVMELPQSLAEAIADGLAFDRAVAVLRRYSFVKGTEAGLAVHSLVQAVTRARLPDLLPWADTAIALVNAAFPDDSHDVRSWPVCALLRSHVEAALAAAQDLPTDAAHTSRLLDRLARYLQFQGLYPAAQPLFQRTLAIREQALGSEHPDVAASLHNLALLYRAQGRYSEAKPLYQRALAIYEQALGPKHPQVTRIRNSLSTFGK